MLIEDRAQQRGEYLKDLKLESSELASLYTVCWRLQSQGVRENERKELLESVLPIALREPIPKGSKLEILTGLRTNRIRATFGLLVQSPIVQPEPITSVDDPKTERARAILNNKLSSLTSFFIAGTWES